MKKTNWRALVLDRALKLIQRRWAKNTLARDASGREVEPESPDACAFCAVGALRRAEYELKVPSCLRGKTARLVKGALGEREDPDTSLSGFNDSSPNKRRVVALFERVRAQV